MPQSVQAQEAPAAPGAIPASETAVHPFDTPITNEHTANMTMARTSALEYYNSGKWAMAESKFKEALDEARLGFDATDPHIASCQNNLAEFYRNTGKHAQAEQLYKEALELLRSAYGEKHWLYVSCMHNLALSYQTQGNLAMAKDTMEEVLKLRLQMFGPRHFLCADSKFALGHILLKQAAEAAAQQKAQDPKKKGWFGRGSQGPDVKGLERKAFSLMNESVAMLEEAENVQVTVILGWLTDLGQQYRSRGRTADALMCARKAMYHFTNDKGEQHAQASALSDTLIELLVDSGNIKEARDVAADCASARQLMFGRELAVASSYLRLATLEVQAAKRPGGGQEASPALQFARTAATLAGELMGEYAGGGAGASVATLLGRASNDRPLKRARAAHVYASSLKFAAEQAPLNALGNKQTDPRADSAKAAVQGDTVTRDLEVAVTALEATVQATTQELKKLSLQGERQESAATKAEIYSRLDELAGVHVELQLLLFECLEGLIVAMGLGPGSDHVRVVQLRALTQQLLQ